MVPAMEQTEWIGGDGGPLVVLQAKTASAWRGADRFEESLTGGGTLENDYDVACSADGHKAMRHGQDFLVLDDASWPARMLRAADGTVVIEQAYYEDEQAPRLLDRLAALSPQTTFEIDVQDDRLRLLVAADDGDGKGHGSAEVTISPGLKQCAVYVTDSTFALVVRDCPGGAHG